MIMAFLGRLLSCVRRDSSQDLPMFPGIRWEADQPVYFLVIIPDD